MINEQYIRFGCADKCMLRDQAYDVVQERQKAFLLNEKVTTE